MSLSTQKASCNARKTTNKVIFYIIIFAIFGYISSYAFNMILARYLTPRLLGEFNIALRVLSVCSSLALLGTATASKRFLSHFLHVHEELNLAHFVQWNMRVIRISFCITISIAVLSYVIMQILHIWHIKDIRTYHLAIYMLWVTPISAMFTLLNSYLLCADAILSYKFIQSMKYAVGIILFLMMVFLAKFSVDKIMLILMLILVNLILLLAACFLLKKNTPTLLSDVIRALCLRTIPEYVLHADWFPISIRLATHGIMARIIFSIDLILIGIMVPNKDAVGLYAIALTIASVLFVIPQSLYTILKANISDMVEIAEGRKRLQAEFQHLNRLTLGIGLFLSVLILVYSKTLLYYFGMFYLQATPIVNILLFGCMIGSFSFGPISMLIYGGYESLILKISICELIAILLLGSILTYLFGPVGTAVATSTVLVCKTVILHVSVYRQTKIKTYLL